MAFSYLMTPTVHITPPVHLRTIYRCTFHSPVQLDGPVLLILQIPQSSKFSKNELWWINQSGSVVFRTLTYFSITCWQRRFRTWHVTAILHTKKTSLLLPMSILYNLTHRCIYNRTQKVTPHKSGYLLARSRCQSLNV